MENSSPWWQPDGVLWREVYLALQKILAAAVLILGHRGLDAVIAWADSGRTLPTVTRILQAYFIVAFGVLEARLILDAVVIFIFAAFPRQSEVAASESAKEPEK